MIISSVKVSLQNSRWEVCVVWEGFPMVIRVGTGATVEEATLNALNQVVKDVTDPRCRREGDALPAPAAQLLEGS